MKISIQIIIIIGFLLFGTLWVKALYDVATTNSIFSLFIFESTPIKSVNYTEHSDPKKMIIEYSYEVKGTTYSDQITASKVAFNEKVGKYPQPIIYYNKVIPKVSYINNWKIDTYHNLVFVIFSFFFGLMIFFHFMVNKGM